MLRDRQRGEGRGAGEGDSRARQGFYAAGKMVDKFPLPVGNL